MLFPSRACHVFAAELFDHVIWIFWVTQLCQHAPSEGVQEAGKEQNTNNQTNEHILLFLVDFSYLFQAPVSCYHL